MIWPPAIQALPPCRSLVGYSILWILHLIKHACMLVVLLDNDCPVLEHTYWLALSTCRSMGLEPLCPCIWLMYLTCWPCIHYSAYSTLRLWGDTVLSVYNAFLLLFKACITPIQLYAVGSYTPCIHTVHVFMRFTCTYSFCNYTTSMWSELVHYVQLCIATLIVHVN